ncbi:STAS/SEC14 domain-containing protein [Colwellia sp. MEBiC06753]
MTTKTHGIGIGIERVNSEFFISLKAVGKLTHQDYQTITPMIDSALASVETPKVKMFFDGNELEGWELRAAWDDFKLGLKHGNEFEKIAVVGNDKWLEFGVKVGAWFVSGEIQYFNNQPEALAWLEQ